MIKHTIKEALQKALSAENITDVSVQVSIPSDPKHGDYTTSVALIAAKKIQKNPIDVAEGLKATLLDMAIAGIYRIDVVAPGFINFRLDNEYIIAMLNESLGGKEKANTGKKVMVEFTDPNPFKEFHIGHLYSNTVGESLSRLLAERGDDVWRVCYQGDVGLHVAKALYGITKNHSQMQEMEDKSLEEKAKFLGQCYALGAKAYEEDTGAKEEIHRLNKLVYEKDSEILESYTKGRTWSLAYFETIYKRLGTIFKKYYFESEVGQKGVALVKEYVDKGVFVKSNGAIIYPGEKEGLHSRVFLNSLGLPTYEAKDLGLAPMKYQDFSYDLSIIITAQEQSDYFTVVLAALKKINPDLAAKTKHIAHGMVRLPQGKMSSRTGNVLTGEWLLDSAKEKIQKAYPTMDKAAAEIVAVGAVKYALLKGSIGKNIEFNFDESISFEGNSGPYLQYSYVRTQSILRKSDKTIGSPLINPYHDNLEQEEVLLLRTLLHFDEVLEKAAKELSPSTVATYLFDLAQKFNNYYQKHTIVGSEQETFRLGLIQVVGETIKQGLNLLGISVPQRM